MYIIFMDVSYGAMNPINILEGIQNNFDSRASQVKFENTKAFQMFATRIRKFGDQVNNSTHVRNLSSLKHMFYVHVA